MVKQFVLVFIFSLVYSTFGLDTNYSPVLFFKNKENKNSYPKSVISSTTPMNQRDFEKIISTLDPNQRIVFLVTDDLSPEDLSIKNEHNRRGFQNLATGLDIVDYIPYVQNAVDNKITMGKNIARTKLISNNELEPKPSDDARIIIVSLPECDELESRYHCMARIDRACYALATSEEFKDVLFVLSSEMNSHLTEVHTRRTRDTGASATPPEPTGHIYKHPNSLVYFKDLVEHSTTKGNVQKDTIVDVTDVKTNVIDKNNIEIKFESKYPILFHFTLNNGDEYWSLNDTKSTFDNVFINNTDISAPQNFSFSCNSSIHLKFQPNTNDLDYVYFAGLQLQVNFTNSGANLEKFADAYDCVGFTSPAIWSALFISFLLLTIISIAITYIMDIRTMDRFDDPKGKTITINASE